MWFMYDLFVQLAVLLDSACSKPSAQSKMMCYAPYVCIIILCAGSNWKYLQPPIKNTGGPGGRRKKIISESA